MNKRIGEFLKELFGDRKFSYIYDMETNTLYFNPYEVLKDAGYTKSAIQDKVINLDKRGKKKFTKDMLSLNVVLNHIQSPSISKTSELGRKKNSNGVISNAGQYWVTIYALIDMLQGRKAKATEIKNWLIYEVLPQIMEKGAYIDESATAEQLLEVKKEIDEKVGQARLEERNRRAFTAKQICKLIHVPNLRYETLFRYLEENKYGTIIYKNGQMVKFIPNGRFDSRIVNSEKGSARRVSNGYVEFFEEFADTINASEGTLEILRTLNEMKEEQIKFL